MHGYDGTDFHTKALVEFIRVSTLRLGGDLRFAVTVQQLGRRLYRIVSKGTP
ncbi:hypothetical protein BSU04_07520 [Caballeronia sordidicola]|uniref:Uncharacterized protein n=1 Tax=Caballeronia sordidicola TaxID=196367 RepID=A0A226X765_CABSO|nr:hypothetical protein BSU04_07520 [Caballeronia sordidicola]